MIQNSTISKDDCSSVEGENGAWARLHEKVPTSANINVLLGLESPKSMKSTTTRKMSSVLDELTAFARRMLELNKEQELNLAGSHSGLCANQAGGVTSVASGQDTSSTQAAAPAPDPTVGLPGNLSSMSSRTLHHIYPPKAYLEIQDAIGNCHKLVAFLYTGVDTTLMKLSTMKGLDLAGYPFMFTYGTAGGDIVMEATARYTVRV
ncbi:hypothetical protein SK128_016835 [Halocaridina rubra]|uniref:Uncharacterized protein n=1 Tax=Halocaridina rubra TaxID=373956 RepID=A0AAN8WTU1_HALRR